MVGYRIATREEHNDLLLQITFEERKEQHEPFVGIAHDISLLEHVHGGGFFRVIDVDVQGAGAERYAGEIGDFGGLCGRE